MKLEEVPLFSLGTAFVSLSPYYIYLLKYRARLGHFFERNPALKWLKHTSVSVFIATVKQSLPFTNVFCAFR